jgi:hypothetical protein
VWTERRSQHHFLWQHNPFLIYLFLGLGQDSIATMLIFNKDKMTVEIFMEIICPQDQKIKTLSKMV